MNLAIVMPVVLQTEALVTLTREAVSHLKSKHPIILYVVCNRLHVRLPEVLREDLQSQFQGRVIVVHEPGVERSVAGAWNKGCELALSDNADYIAVVANDTRLHANCLDELIDFGDRNSIDLWSGISCNNRSDIDPDQTTDGADFSCFMIRPTTLRKHGFFDPNYRPAYFEDNDYYGRVVLGGGECMVVHSAQFFHHGSMTVREDAEMAHHVGHWFEKNRAYFARKWGVARPENSRQGVLRSYYGHPFNDPNKPLSWFPTNGDTP
jgi:GT2 family glycosyltransferase